MSNPWVFGYGSILWKPDFPYAEAVPVTLLGYARRFWQDSPDHRGTAQSPGRVVTLVPEPASRVWGMAFRVDPAHADEVFARLDHREQGGYDRVPVELLPTDTSRGMLRGVVYIAGPSNPHYAGDTPLASIARQVAGARGKSGTNRDYLYELARVLRENDVDEPHVFTLEQLVRQAS
jgi:cation transport protein ChaC